MRKRRLRKDRLLILVAITLVFTIALLIAINTLIEIISSGEKDEKIAINYDVEPQDDLLDLPLSIIDSNHLYYEGDFLYYEDAEYTSLLGIDVSSHQEEVDWQAVKDAGISFVYIRCGYRGYQSGILNADSLFYDHYKGAKEVGLDVGVYFFSHAINTEEAIEEAYFTYEMIKDLDIDLEVVYDLEDISYDESRLDSVNPEVYTENAMALAYKIKEFGYKPMIYTNLYWATEHYDLEQIMNYPLWYAQYNNEADFPYLYKLWQYTDSGEVAGIDVPTDLNIMLVEK